MATETHAAQHAEKGMLEFSALNKTFIPPPLGPEGNIIEGRVERIQELKDREVGCKMLSPGQDTAMAVLNS